MRARPAPRAPGGLVEVFNYTIMGDAVNLAARLESANKQYGTGILVGEETWKHAREEFEFRRVDRIRVKGKSEPTEVFELLGPRGSVSEGTLARGAAYEDAFSDYVSGRFAEALERLDVLLCEVDDGPARVLRERCAQYRVDPPPDDWAGVYTMQTK